MESPNFSVHQLETHLTKDVNDSHVNGNLTVVWRDWDDILPNHPKMVYLNTVNPREIKGPHLHKNRTTHFCCIEGNLVIIVKDGKEFHEIKTDAKDVCLLLPESKGDFLTNLCIPGFSSQPTIRIFTADMQCCRFNAGNIAMRNFN